MKNTFTFNSAKEIYDTIMSGQDLYCLDTGEFFTMFDDMYIALNYIDPDDLRSFAEQAYDNGSWSIYDEIHLVPEVLEPNIITPDGTLVTPSDPDYDNVDAAIFDYSSVIDNLSDLPGKKFINANVTDLLNDPTV